MQLSWQKRSIKDSIEIFGYLQYSSKIARTTSIFSKLSWKTDPARNGNLIKFSYSGATSLHLGHYSQVLLNENPDEVIIQAGTNDIVGSNKRDVDA